MSGEAILLAIREEADREVAGVLAAARQRADALVAEAEAAAEARVAGAVAAAEPELAADAARMVNAARLRLLHFRAEQRARQVDAVFSTAERELAAIADEGGRRWHEALARLIAMASARVGPGATFSVRRADGRIAQRSVGDLGALDIDTVAVAGVRARSADGRIEVDAALSRRLERARTLLADRVVDALEGGAATGER